MPKNLRNGANAENALTIARAELIALLMAVNVGPCLQNAYRNQIKSKHVFYFTDSLLNLQRIQRGKGHCKMWAEKRVCKIIDNLQASQVRFCPGNLNPADLPSRGCMLTELIDKDVLWIEGPGFLTKPMSEWPKQPMQISNPDAPVDPQIYEHSWDCQPDIAIYFTQIKVFHNSNLEQKESQVYSLQKRQSTSDFFHTNIDRLVTNSRSWLKIVKVLVLMRRLANKARELFEQRQMRTRTPMHRWLSQAELSWAELVLIRRAQQVSFPAEIKTLKRGNSSHENKLSRTSPLKHLPVYWDHENESTRLESRLHLASSLDFSFTNPIIIPKDAVAERKILHLH